ncbi:hypothetical protein [Micromonospora sp. CB01531]|uniref:hypothetical protein n=1 Tax=Micromonospora sp. CB01531 TaxID=1718947 RepID=UPI00093D4DAD|nr:hypothetical protein [Micromonospora sp. CB01531]OKI45093.1 hypothetical protein A6A27_11785 [Micromonospora sp. CB01531]
MRKILPTLAVLLAVATLGAVEGRLADRPEPTTQPAAVVQVETEPAVPALPAPIEGLPECPTEDSEGPCNWYGGSNGLGAKFAALPETGQPVPADMAEALAEEPGQADRDWSVCTWYVGDTSWVVCPDGYALGS